MERSPAANAAGKHHSPSAPAPGKGENLLFSRHLRPVPVRDPGPGPE